MFLTRMSAADHGPPPPPEPKTPNWLPALGAALFLLVFVWWLATPAPAPAAGASPDASGAQPK